MPFLGCWFCLSGLGSSSFSLTSVLAAALLPFFSPYLFLGMLGWTCRLHPEGTALREGDLREVVWESLPLRRQRLGQESLCSEEGSLPHTRAHHLGWFSLAHGLCAGRPLISGLA